MNQIVTQATASLQNKSIFLSLTNSARYFQIIMDIILINQQLHLYVTYIATKENQLP